MLVGAAGFEPARIQLPPVDSRIRLPVPTRALPAAQCRFGTTIPNVTEQNTNSKHENKQKSTRSL